MFTCTSEDAPEHGFTLMEALVGLVVAVVLVVAVSGVWVGLERRGATWNDRVVLMLQSRVAEARLERDLRLATAEGCAGVGSGPIVAATPTEIILVSRCATNGDMELVEWELTGGSLMRRRIPWPGQLPRPLNHAAFTDHKTMLDGVVAAPGFRYLCGTQELPSPVTAEDRALIDTVEVRSRLTGGVEVGWWAEVGR
ncbi:MAG: hypothetical protein GX604_04630 [Actinobacteria bacterium]|nr:hypothetical protein [Actinomycetota bacterium]